MKNKGYTLEEIKAMRQKEKTRKELAATPEEKESLKILILATDPNNQATARIKQVAQNRGHSVIVHNPNDLILYVNEKLGHDHVFNGNNTLSKPERIYAKDVDAVITRIGTELEYGASVLEHFRQNLNTFCTQSGPGLLTSADKFLTHQALSQNKIATPTTIKANRDYHPEFIIEKLGGYPFWMKRAKGSQGKNVFPMLVKEQINHMNDLLSNRDENVLFSAHIDSGGIDYRVIVIDYKVVAVMKRKAAKGELRSNASLGAEISKADLDQDAKDLCIKAAFAVGLPCAGVDLIKDKEGKNFILEINGNPGYKIEFETNQDVTTPLIEYCENNYRLGGRFLDVLSLSSAEVELTKAMLLMQYIKDIPDNDFDGSSMVSRIEKTFFSSEKEDFKIKKFNQMLKLSGLKF